MTKEALEFVRAILDGDFGPYANPEGRIADILEANGQRLADARAEIDALTRERDEARAEAARFKTHNLHLVKTIDSNRAEDGERIAALEAEVERLRPAAEAWEKREAYDAILLGESYPGWDDDLRKAYYAREEAIARAREAAKGGA